MFHGWTGLSVSVPSTGRSIVRETWQGLRMEQANSTNARTAIAGSKKCSECQSNTTQSEKPGPLLQVALTLIEQTVGAGPVFRTERSSTDTRDILETPRLIAGTHEMSGLGRKQAEDRYKKSPTTLR